MSPAHALSALAARLAKAPRIGPELRDTARQRLFDTLLAALIGRTLPESLPLASLSWKKHGLRALTATVRATEVDDIALSGCVTAGSVVVSAALHVAASSGAGIEAVHDAMLAGYEAMVGFATAIGGAEVIYRGVWPTLTAAPMGAAAVAARIWALDEEQTLAALALAIGRSAWRHERLLPRWLSLGDAAADGVQAAEAAQAGFSAPAAILQSWAETAGVALEPKALGPAADFRIRQVDAKPYPTARQGLAAIEAFSQLQAQQPAARQDRIVIGLPSAYRGMVGETGMPTSRMASLVSAAYQMALVALAPGAIDDDRRLALPGGPAIADFLSRVTVEIDRDLDAAFPQAWGGSVRIEPPAGPVRQASVLAPRGSAANPFGWPQLDEKAHRLGRANGLDLAAVQAVRDAVRDDAPPDVLLGWVSR